MAGLIVFTQLVLAGCIFLLYFVWALWRDARKQGPRVEVRRLHDRTQGKGKLLYMHSVDTVPERKRN
jgi:threonine/homoserine/homoserine lactone efflux protein